MSKLLKKILFLIGLVLVFSMMFGITVFADEEKPKYVMDAEALSNGKIAVLYLKGETSNSGELYLGIYNPLDNHFKEVPVGETAPVAKEAALAVLENTAHVAYITTEDKIVYTYQTGSTWAEETIISSVNANGDAVADTLSCPDIAVDSNGKAHITYTDSDGAGDSDYHKADGMYATNASGNFIITVVANCTGEGDSWGRWYDEIAQPVKISIENNQPQFAYSIYTYDYAAGSGTFKDYNFHFVTTEDKTLHTNSGGRIYEVCKSRNSLLYFS